MCFARLRRSVEQSEEAAPAVSIASRGLALVSSVVCFLSKKVGGGVCRTPRNIYNIRAGSCCILQIFTTFVVAKGVDIRRLKATPTYIIDVGRTTEASLYIPR